MKYQSSATAAAKLARVTAEFVLKKGFPVDLKSVADLKERKKALKGAYVPSAAVKGKTILLFDDLYRSGASMQEAARTLLEAGEAVAVYALALTRTRTNR